MPTKDQIIAQALVATGEMPEELVIKNQKTIDELLEAFQTVGMLLEVHRANGYRLLSHSALTVYLVKDGDD